MPFVSSGYKPYDRKEIRPTVGTGIHPSIVSSYLHSSSVFNQNLDQALTARTLGNQSFAKIRAWKKDSLEHPSTCVANPSRINRLTPRNWERNRFSDDQRYAKTQDHKAMNQRLNLTSRSSRQQTVEKSEKMFQEFSFPLVPRSTFQSCGWWHYVEKSLWLWLRALPVEISLNKSLNQKWKLMIRLKKSKAKLRSKFYEKWIPFHQ